MACPEAVCPQVACLQVSRLQPCAQMHPIRLNRGGSFLSPSRGRCVGGEHEMQRAGEGERTRERVRKRGINTEM